MSSEGKRRKLASENRKEKRPFVTHHIPPLPTLFVLSSQPSFLPGYQPQGPIFTQPRPVLSPSRLTVLPPSNLSTLFQKKRESKKTRPPVFKFSSHSHIPCVCTYIYGRGKRKALSNAKPRKRSRHAGLPLFPKFERKKKSRGAVSTKGPDRCLDQNLPAADIYGHKTSKTYFSWVFGRWAWRERRAPC